MLILKQKSFRDERYNPVYDMDPGARTAVQSAKYAFDKKEDYEKKKWNYASD